jgi:hypothetical protein
MNEVVNIWRWVEKPYKSWLSDKLYIRVLPTHIKSFVIAPSFQNSQLAP